MDRFNPFDFIKNKGLFETFRLLENSQQIPWLKNYINNLLGPDMEYYVNNLLGPDFWTQLTGNRQFGFNKIDVFQTTNEVIVMAEMPGMEKESDVRIFIKGLTLYLEVTVPAGNTQTQPDGVFPHKETNNQSGRKITRSINLPSPVNSFGAKAIYKNGVFEIRLPKEPLPDESHIEVQFL